MLPFAGENLVSKSPDEVEEQQGEGIARNRWLAGANVAKQEQSESRFERRRWRQAEDGSERRQSLDESSATGRTNGERGGRGDQCHVMKFQRRSWRYRTRSMGHDRAS